MTDIHITPLTMFDVFCAHDPPGTRPGERVEGLRMQCWVKKIAAKDPNQAGEKAEKFLTEQRGVRNIKVTRWRFSRAPQEEEMY